MDTQEITARSEEPPQWDDLHETNEDEPPLGGAPRGPAPLWAQFPHAMGGLALAVEPPAQLAG